MNNLIKKESRLDEYLKECPWIRDVISCLPDNIQNSLCENSIGIHSLMRSLSIPAFLKISKVKKYAKIDNDMMHILNVFYNDKKLQSSVVSFVKINIESLALYKPLFINISKGNLPDSAYLGNVFHWCLNYHDDVQAVGHQEIIDFFNTNHRSGNIPYKSTASLIKAINKWHERLAQSSASDCCDKIVSYGNMPLEYEYGGIKLTALQTEKDLHIEGKIMHHCVKSYHRNLIEGSCRIYSAASEYGERLGTIEIYNHKFGVSISGGFETRQRKYKYNDPVSSEVNLCVDKFIKELNAIEVVDIGENNIEDFHISRVQEAYMTTEELLSALGARSELFTLHGIRTYGNYLINSHNADYDRLIREAYYNTTLNTISERSNIFANTYAENNTANSVGWVKSKNVRFEGKKVNSITKGPEGRVDIHLEGMETVNLIDVSKLNGNNSIRRQLNLKKETTREMKGLTSNNKFHHSLNNKHTVSRKF